MKLKCYNCKFGWNYKGTKKIHATCPDCKRNIRIERALVKKKDTEVSIPQQTYVHGTKQSSGLVLTESNVKTNSDTYKSFVSLKGAKKHEI